MLNPERIRLRLLGRFGLSVDVTPPRLVRIASPLRRGMIAYLAMQPSGTETRERIAALLWGERADRQARQSLRQSLLVLRSELEAAGSDLLQADRDTVGIDVARFEVDARILLDLARTPDDWRTGEVDLPDYGEFLDGLHIESESFEDWLRVERARLAAAAATLFAAEAERQDTLGRGSAAIVAAERLVALDPLREDGQRVLLRLLARHRGREAAMAQAALLVQLLRRELNAPSDPQTQALIDEIQRDAIGLAPAALPASTQATELPKETAPPEVESIAARVSTTPPGATAAAPKRRTWFPQSAAFGWWFAGAAVIGVVIALMLLRNRATLLDLEQARAIPNGAVEDSADTGWRPPSILAAGAEQALAANAISTLAVLPFSTEKGASQADRVLARRLGDDLINDLSRVPSLRVIARQTSRLYADRVVDSAAVGAELGVRYVVDGGLQVQDDTMRINIALVDARTRLQVWADRFERDRSSRFAAQDEIARGLARALHVNVMAAEERRRPASVSDPGVNDLLAKAWFSMLRISDTGANPQTEKTFEEVLRRDPDNGSALLGLGGYHVTVAAMFLAPDAPSHIAKAETFLDRALRQNPNASLVHYFLGNLYKLQGRPEEALGAYTRVLELNPSFAPAYAQVGHVLSRIGRIGEAMEHVRYAMRLSPKDPSLGLWSLFAGEIELELGHDQAALDWLTRAIRTDPRSPFAHASLAAAMALRGDDSGAEREALQVENIAPWLTRDRMIARLTGLSEHGGEPRRLIEGLRKAFPRSG